MADRYCFVLLQTGAEVIRITGLFSFISAIKFFSTINFSARLYLCLTLIVAASALGIYNQGGFGIAHVLAVLTLIAITGGFVMEKYKIFGSMSKYFQALGYTSTLLFHMIPAITDFLRRLPIGDPFIDSFEDPLLMNFHLSFLLVYLIGISYQMYWLRQQ